MIRWILAASGGVAAFVTLLPAVIAAFIMLFDVSAHGLLGMSGTLLNLASPIGDGGGGGGGGAGLPSYRGVDVDVRRVAALSLLRGLPPVAMIVLAVLRARPSPRRHWTMAAACAALACVTAGWPALPGLVAALLLARTREPGTRSCNPPAAGSDPS